MEVICKECKDGLAFRDQGSLCDVCLSKTLWDSSTNQKRMERISIAAREAVDAAMFEIQKQGGVSKDPLKLVRLINDCTPKVGDLKSSVESFSEEKGRLPGDVEMSVIIIHMWIDRIAERVKP